MECATGLSEEIFENLQKLAAAIVVRKQVKRDHDERYEWKLNDAGLELGSHRILTSVVNQ